VRVFERNVGPKNVTSSLAVKVYEPSGARFPVPETV